MRVGAVLWTLAVAMGLFSPKAANGADLSEVQIREALGKLSALMEIDMPTKARWVVVENGGQKWCGAITEGDDPFPATGNAFLLKEKPGVEASVFLVARGTVMRIRAEDLAESVEIENPDGVYPSSWKAADVAKDVAAAVEWLKKTAKKAAAGDQETPGRSDPFPGARDEQRETQLQTALLWAAMLQHAGHVEQATVLAQTVVAGSDEGQRRQMLNGLFERFANSAYQRALNEFGDHRDWARLKEGLNAVVQRYPVAWSNRDAVRVLSHRVGERALLPAVPPLKTLNPLPEAEQKVLLDWLKEIEEGKQPPYSRWTLPAAPTEGEEGASEAESPHETKFPKSHGLAAVRLLGNLLTDETLTAAGLMRNEYAMTSPWAGSGDDDPAENLRQAYSYLSKPQTRAQVAWSCLQQVLPQEMYHMEESDPTARAKEVLDWHESVKDVAPSDLALAYLEGGTKDPMIMAHAIETTDPKKFAKLEGLMIEQAQIYDPGELEPFVEKLGPEKGIAFIAKLKQKFEADLSSYGDRGEDRMAKRMEAGLKRLELAAKGEKKTLDLPAMLTLLAATGDDASEDEQMALRDVYQQISKVMGKLPLEARLKAVLPVLKDFKSPMLANYVLSLAFQQEAQQLATGKGKPSSEHKKLLEETRPHWEALLEAKPQAENETQQQGYGGLGQVVLYIQFLAAGNMDSQAVAYLSTLENRGMETLRQHGTALLKGEAPPPLPVASAIDAEQRKQAIAAWSGKTLEEFTKGIEAMDIKSLMVMNEALARESEVPDVLKPYLWRIGQVEAPTTPEAKDWLAYRGKSVDKDVLVDLAKQVANSASHAVTYVHLRRSAPVLGWKLTVKESVEFKEAWGGRTLVYAAQSVGQDLPKVARRLSTAYFQYGRRPLAWNWADAPITEQPAAEKPEGAPPTSEGDLAMARELIREVRVNELQSWKGIRKILDERPPGEMSFYIFSTSAETLAKQIKKD